jgi:hypothetical protein
MMEVVALGTMADHAGRWVALDIRSHEVVLVADSPQELDEAVRAAGIVADVAVMRAPREDEPLFVGPW